MPSTFHERRYFRSPARPPARQPHRRPRPIGANTATVAVAGHLLRKQRKFRAQKVTRFLFSALKRGSRAILFRGLAAHIYGRVPEPAGDKRNPIA